MGPRGWGLGLAIGGSLVLSGPGYASDWPQWRGPNRDGIAQDSPTLADSWPSGGPPRIWQSEAIPSGNRGNLSSPVVAGGKVFLYVTWANKVPIKTGTLSESGLRKLGWFPEKLPEDLATAVEEARLSDERAELPQDDVTGWIAEWIAERLVTEEQKKLTAVIQSRLTRGRNALPSELLDKLAQIKDREFSSREELDRWLTDNGIDGDRKKTVLNQVPTTKASADDVVLCLDATSGKTLWNADFPGIATGYSFSSTPCVTDGRLYVMVSTRDAYCLNAENGQVIWKTRATQGNSISSSFLVADGLAVILSGCLTAFDAESGEIKWTQPKINGNNPSPVLWRVGDRACVICNTGDQVGCADLTTGEMLWTAPGGGSSTTVASSRFLAVFSTHKQVGLTGYRLGVDRADKAWSIEITDRGSSPVIADGYVYAVGGRGSARVMCVKADSGETTWDEKIATQEISSPILADGKIIGVLDNYRSLATWKASPQSFTLLAKTRMPLAACTCPAFAEGKLYLRLRKAVACYDLRVPGAGMGTDP